MLGSASFGITFLSIFARDFVKIWIEAVFNQQQHLFFAQDVGRTHHQILFYSCNLVFAPACFISGGAFLYPKTIG